MVKYTRNTNKVSRRRVNSRRTCNSRRRLNSRRQKKGG